MVGIIEKENDASGIPTGDDVTQANSALGGDQFDRYIIPTDLGTAIGGGNTFNVVTTPTPPALPVGMKWFHLDQSVGTGEINFYWTKPTARNIWATQFYMYIIKGPTTGNVVVLRAFSNNAYGSAALSVDFNINSSRTTYLRRTNPSDAPANGANSAALALNTIYTCSLLVNYSSLTATMNFYTYGSSSLVTSCTVSFGVANVVQSLRWGLSTASADAEILLGYLHEGYNDFLPRPDQQNVGPTITSTTPPEQGYQVGTVVEAAWSSHDNDGTVATLVADMQSWPVALALAPTITDKSGAALTGIGSATATRTSQFTMSSVGRYVIRANSTDNIGGAAPAITRTFYAHPPQGVDTIIESVTLNSFIVVGGPPSTSAGAITALQDGNNATAIDSGTNPTNQRGSIKLGPLGPTGIDFYAIANVINGGTLTRRWETYRSDHITPVWPVSGGNPVTQTGITGLTPEVKLSLDAAALASIPFNSSTDVERGRGLWVDFIDTVA